MAQLAIKGHSTRGKEVIELLEMLGGKIRGNRLAGNEVCSWYYIHENGYIDYKHYSLFYDTTVFILERFLEMFPYKVGDKVQHKGATSCGSVFEVEKMRWVDNHVEYTIKRLHYNNCHTTVTTEDLQAYEEIAMEEQKFLNPKANSIAEKIKQETKKVKEFFESKMNLTIQDIKDNNAEWLLNKLQEMSAEGALQTISDLYDELHTPQYPKTYEECCRIADANPYVRLIYDLSDGRRYSYDADNLRCYENIRKLLICRDAYWKIAGDWVPNFGETFIYDIGTYYGVVEKRMVAGRGILVFPTEEMRDAFYENFKDLINETKELL